MESLNRALFQIIFGLSHKNFFLDYLVVFFAQYLPYFLVLGFFLFVFLEKGRRVRLFLFTETLLAIILSRGILTEIFRFFYSHERPFDALGITALIKESGNSFPSGHASFLFALATIIFYSNRKWGGWFFALATVNGLARIFAGVHWPLDILGGAIVGLGSGFLIHLLLKPEREKVVPPVTLHG